MLVALNCYDIVRTKNRNEFKKALIQNTLQSDCFKRLGTSDLRAVLDVLRTSLDDLRVVSDCKCAEIL